MNFGSCFGATIFILIIEWLEKMVQQGTLPYLGKGFM